MPHGSSFLANKLRKFVRLSDRELECLAQLQSSTVDVKRGKELVREGQTGHVAYILHSGWACSSKILPDGGRQIITFPVPGDCVGLRSMLLRTADHSFSALTDAVVSRVEAPRFAGVLDDSHASLPQFYWRYRGTKRWWWSTWSALYAAAQLSEPPISFSLFGIVCGWSDWQLKPNSPALSVSTYWPMRLASVPFM